MDGWERRRPAGCAASGGAWRELAGELAGDDQNALSGTKQNGKGTKIKRGARGFHRATRRRRGAGGGDRRRGRNSDSASLGAEEERRSSGSGVVWRGAQGVPFIGLGGGEEGALEAVGRHTGGHH
jgi:hypothetical protein